MSRLPRLTPVFLLVASLAACAPGGGRGGDEALAGENSGLRERAATRVVTAVLERREMTRVLETTSVVESEAEIEVVPRLPGQVLELLVEENDPVEAGQVLARLEASEEQLALRESEISLTEAEQGVATARLAVDEAKSRIAAGQRSFEQAERDYQRDVSLASTSDNNRYGLLSDRDVEASQLARDQAEQDLAQFEVALERAVAEASAAEIAVTKARVVRDRAALTLERMSIRAPIDGTIDERMCRVGDQVTTTEPVYRITDVEDLRTVFFRPQRELALFTGGPEGLDLSLTATAEAVPGARFEGRIERVSPTVDSASGSFRITAHLDRHAVGGEPNENLAPGMLVRIMIVTDRRADALAAPKRAVQREGDEAFVRRVVAGEVNRVAVVEGYTDNEYVEITATGDQALFAGDRLIVVGGRDLEDGAPVEDASPATPASSEQG